jgi:heme O synthase-like polyprenyltransferase
MAALILGGWVLWDTWMVIREPDDAMKLFTTSTVYLAALFASVLLDVMI